MGSPRSEDTVDIFVGSDLPYNHYPYLHAHTDVFSVVGTACDRTDIIITVPTYVEESRVSDLFHKSLNLNKTMLTLDEVACPACSKFALQLISQASPTTWSVGTGMTNEEFVQEANKMMADKDKFAAVQVYPQWVFREAPMKELQGDLGPFARTSASRTLARRDILDRLPMKVRNVLSGMFLPSRSVLDMDVLVHKGSTPQEAADLWISKNMPSFQIFLGECPSTIGNCSHSTSMGTSNDAAVSSKRALRIGTTFNTFHQVKGYVVGRALERIGYTITYKNDVPHAEVYPLFLNARSTNTVDIFVGSDLPFNHISYLQSGFDEFSVVGTVCDRTDIIISVPDYVATKFNLTHVSDLRRAPPSLNRQVMTLSEADCPACAEFASQLFEEVGMQDWRISAELSSESFVEEAKRKIAERENFVVVWLIPSWINAAVHMQELSGDIGPFARTSASRILARNDILASLPDESRDILSAVFLPSTAVLQMDSLVHGDPGMSPQKAADVWISENHATYEVFFNNLTLS